MAWQEEQELLARWSAELTERILAGEFDDDLLWAGDPVTADADPRRSTPPTPVSTPMSIPTTSIPTTSTRSVPVRR